MLTIYKKQCIQQHKSLAAIATCSKSSIGWFFDCKLHLIMSQSDNIIHRALLNGLQQILKWSNIRTW
ncbi:hypothetical protein IF090_00860 [Acinetobacter towneri]|uniref:transposase n=1 Tax=Acinetobacter towneri TaxID=202956 RepID=UPI001CE1D3C8|nr:transposase [Acinetobacter towneri]MCA4778208.1 hypothetical protein [Acinetobacter towneri]MCA4783537.1 hypothetical protein [Acinetobacter towneri]MCA4786119.1 hypothetical protein [Acinetobacter towneri]MCA4794875.1 hypothetical protein [Acinetobacter towneri]MCA4799612.1 hypothetical protein [Acinetobacter towneri]